jgi:hypothetical protein
MDYAFGIIEPWDYEMSLPSAYRESWDSFAVEDAKFILTEEPDNYYNGPFDIIKPDEVEDYLELAGKERLFLSGDPVDLAEMEWKEDIPVGKDFHRYPLEEHIDRAGVESTPEEVLSAAGLADYNVECLEDVLEYQ